MSVKRKIRILVSVTDPVTTIFLRGQMSYMKQKGLDITLLTSPGQIATDFVAAEGIHFRPCSMEREIALKHDLSSLLRIYRIIRRLKPSLISVATPKAGLLVTIAAWLCRVPCRVYTLHGLRLETASGIKYSVLKMAERISCTLSSEIICDSPSLREKVMALGLTKPDKVIVLGKGSCNGLDTEHFAPTSEISEKAQLLKKQLEIGDDEFVVGFIGRIVRDKGIVELLQAWKNLRDQWPKSHLLLIGPLESGDAVPAQVEQEIRSDSRIHVIGYVADTRPYYAAMDMLVLPSYREGLGQVLLEASAMEVPVVATRVTGCVDAVEDGETGTLVPARDAEALTQAIETYLASSELREKHGVTGRQRILREFRQEVVWEANYEEYMRLLREKNIAM